MRVYKFVLIDNVLNEFSYKSGNSCKKFDFHCIKSSFRKYQSWDYLHQKSKHKNGLVAQPDNNFGRICWQWNFSCLSMFMTVCDQCSCYDQWTKLLLMQYNCCQLETLKITVRSGVGDKWIFEEVRPKGQTEISIHSSTYTKSFFSKTIWFTSSDFIE